MPSLYQFQFPNLGEVGLIMAPTAIVIWIFDNYLHFSVAIGVLLTGSTDDAGYWVGGGTLNRTLMILPLAIRQHLFVSLTFDPGVIFLLITSTIDGPLQEIKNTSLVRELSMLCHVYPYYWRLCIQLHVYLYTIKHV